MALCAGGRSQGTILTVGGCNAGSAEEKWLRADLAAHPVACTLAYFHKPIFTSLYSAQVARTATIRKSCRSGRPCTTRMRTWWWAGTITTTSDLRHRLRWRSQTRNAAFENLFWAQAGRIHRPFTTPHANSEVRKADTFGVLKLTLRPGAYDWQFIPEAGKTFHRFRHG
jgi:acid phosphatase type 7